MSPIKKFFSLLLCLALLCGLLPATAAAASAPTFVLSAGGESSVTAKTGDIITVTLAISADQAMNMSQIIDEVVFDQTFFEYTGTIQKTATGFETIKKMTDSAGKLYIYFNHITASALPYTTANTPMVFGSFQLKVIGTSGSGTVRNTSLNLWSKADGKLQPAGQDLTVTIEGSAQPTQYTMTFNSAGGSYIAPQTAAAGTAFPSIANPTRDGYTFAGWSPALPATVPNQDTTYTATWKKNVSLSFQANGGSGTMNTIRTTEGSYTLPGCGFTAPSGYQFDAWAVGSPSGVKCAPGTSINLTGDTVFYATWKLGAVGPGSGNPSGGGSLAVGIATPVNGSIYASSTKAAKGEVVMLSVQGAAGYEPSAVYVTDAYGRAVAVSSLGNGLYSFVMPDTAVSISAAFRKIEAGEKLVFVDVLKKDYYYDAVYWAVENDITLGTSTSTFSPLLACTRAQAVTFLWRAAGCPKPVGTANPFTDVKAGEYYYDAVQWAFENKITNGVDFDLFGVENVCNRADIMCFIYRMIGSPAVEGTNSFADVRGTDYFANAVQWAVNEGVTNGMTQTSYGPKEDCTRAQIVSFLWRYLAK